MAFFSKVGNILRQSATKHLNPEMAASNPSIFQAVRCMSSSKLFVGGLSYNTDDQSLREAFGNYGQVVEARIITDRETGRSRGFGFITYTSSEEASSAIQALHGQDLHGRQVSVNYATDRVRGGGGGYGGGGGGGGYRGQGNYGGGGGYGGQGNYGGGGGYGGQGNYGGGGGYGGQGNYGGGGGNYGRGEGGYNNDRNVSGGGYGGAGAGGSYSGSYTSGGGGGGANNLDSGSGTIGSVGGDFGVAGGPPSSDNYVSGGADNGFANVDQLDTAGSGSIADVAERDFEQSEHVEENLRDDDDLDNYAKKI